jgi:hypothetical protein
MTDAWSVTSIGVPAGADAPDAALPTTATTPGFRCAAGTRALVSMVTFT